MRPVYGYFDKLSGVVDVGVQPQLNVDSVNNTTHFLNDKFN